MSYFLSQSPNQEMKRQLQKWEKHGEKNLLFGTTHRRSKNSELSVTTSLFITVSFDTGAIMIKTTTATKNLHQYFRILEIIWHHNMLDSTFLF